MIPSAKRGTILITTLWILSILSLISIGVAGRMGLELKLTGLYRDDMKALYLAKAAIERVIYEKDKKDELPEADMLNESWANDKKLFDNIIINDTDKSSYTVKYLYKESLADNGTELYGMMDEASRIDINKIIENDAPELNRTRHLVNLLKNVCKLDENDAEERVNNLIDWMDPDDIRISPPDQNENEIYEGTGEAKYCKNWKLDSIDELLLVKGFDSAILYGGRDGEDKIDGIIDYITVYRDGLDAHKVNVNTAPAEVLVALGFPERLAKAVIDYRKHETTTGELENLPIVQTDIGFFTGLQLDPPMDQEEIDSVDAGIPFLTPISDTFRINVYAKVNRVEKHITCVVTAKSGARPIFKFWSEE